MRNGLSFALVLCLLNLSCCPLSKNTREITYEKTYERYHAVVNKAAEQSDPGVCDQIDFGQWHETLLTSPEESRYVCRADYAVAKEDVEYCRSLSSEAKFENTLSQRNLCLRSLSRRLKRPELCDEMIIPNDEWKTKSFREGCYATVSEN